MGPGAKRARGYTPLVEMGTPCSGPRRGEAGSYWRGRRGGCSGSHAPTLSSHVRRESGDQEYVNDEVKRDGRPRLKSGRHVPVVPVLVVSFP